MRPVTNFTLHAALAAVLAALAASSAAAGGPGGDADSTGFFQMRLGTSAASLKFEGVEGETAIQAFQWGPRQTTSAGGWAKADGLGVSWETPQSTETTGGYGPANTKYSSVKLGRAASSAGSTGSADAGRVTGLATDPSDPAAARTATHEPKPPRDGGLGSESERTFVAPHVLERGRGVDIAAVDGQISPGAGSLSVKGSFPGCAVGKRYAGAQFAAGAMRYELKDVVISNCAPDGLSLSYARVKYNSSPPTDSKVKVRGWDPSKKEN